MLEKIDLNCLNCGAPLNMRTMVCEYCGTRYKSDGVKLPVLPEYIPPKVETLYCSAMVDEHILRTSPDAAHKVAMSRLTQALAKQIIDHVQVTTEKDPYRFCEIVRARIKIVCD